MKNLLSLFGVVYLASCASVGAMIDGGTKMVDATVGTAVDVSGAVSVSYTHLRAHET